MASACRTCTVHHLFFLCPSNLIPLYYLEGFDFIPPIYLIHTNFFFSDRRSASSLYTGSLDSNRSKHPLLFSDASSAHPTCVSLHVALGTVSRSPSLAAPLPIRHRRPRYQSKSLLPFARVRVEVVTEHWLSAARRTYHLRIAPFLRAELPCPLNIIYRYQSHSYITQAG